MNVLVIMAALAAGQCDATGCSVEVTVEVLVVAPLRNTVRFFRDRQPVRNTARAVLKVQPVRRLIRARPVRTFFHRWQPLRRALRRC